MVTNGSFVVHLPSSGDSDVDHYQTAVKSCSGLKGVHEVGQYRPMTMFRALSKVSEAVIWVFTVWFRRDGLHPSSGCLGDDSFACFMAPERCRSSG